ncbi:capsule biosynthesis GfcC family protein [Vibrio sp. 99-70-13A1]|uniref:capsule biosynthesis GfcC family protein n=1 Tax=Vibrio sp. 99-70-13A1 TaxID=2607601 RepID=UPI001493B469|nr:capsule biosynthesis GfcC family protein [Vibrio sp. 99-70-13A1]
MKHSVSIIRSFFYTFLMLASVSMSYASNTPIDTLMGQQKLTVDLPKQGITLSYSKSVRLEQVLSDVSVQGFGSYFPSSAQLFDLSEPSALKDKKEKTFSHLTDYASINPEALQVKEQLSKFEFAPRQFINLDRNVVISQLGKNPILIGRNQMEDQKEPFNFSLYLEPRPENVQVIGVLDDVLSLPLIEHGSISDYVQLIPQGSLGKTADDSFVYVIQPDGHVKKAPYAYWNNAPTYLAPGAMIFIGFSSLPSSHSSLNQDIAELLRNKVNL